MKLPETALVLNPGTLSILFTAGSLAPRTISTTEWAHDENLLNEGVKHEKHKCQIALGKAFKHNPSSSTHTTITTVIIEGLHVPDIALTLHTHIHGHTDLDTYTQTYSFLFQTCNNPIKQALLLSSCCNWGN